MRQGLSRPLWLAVIVVAFALPLFVGLGRTDMENDEAIYSYAVDGILASGDWLNPPLSPFEGHTFLEKPPLKFWLVAAPIRLGLLPHDELGMRVWDVVFGGAAFLYVFLLGWLLAGPFCGLVAVFGLFIYGPLLFEHGLRNNNMEAPLVLSYAGGVYHFLAWASPASGRQRAHAAAVAFYFFLGFMTKFVAVLFLPILLGSVMLVHRATLRKALDEWRWWGLLVCVFLAAAAPWFIYEYWREGNGFFRVMFAEHVYQRFTTSLDPGHVHPWHFYYATIFTQLGYDRLQWLAVGGGALLAAMAVRRPSLEKTTIIAWFAVPLALMSIGSSKLHHYAYPFLPPVMLAVGYGPAWLVRESRGSVEAILTAIHRRFAAWRTWGPMVPRVLLFVAAACVCLAAATLLLGPIQIRFGELQLFRNSQIARPLIVALLLATLAGRGVAVSRALVPAVLFVWLMPVGEYHEVFARMRQERHPLRTARDCMLDVRRSERAAGRPAPGVYAVGEAAWFLHPYYYYFRDIGGWERSGVVHAETVDRGLFTDGWQRPLLLPDDSYQSVRARRSAELAAVTVLPLRGVLLLTPGPYAGCGTQLAPLAVH